MSDRAQQADGGDATLAADLARWSLDARLTALFIAPAGAILVLDRAAEIVVGSHGEAEPVRAAISRSGNVVDPALKLRHQVRSVGEPGTSPRLVRLRLDTRGLGRPVTCLIAAETSAAGETLLLLAPTEALPARRNGGERAPTAPMPVAVAVPAQEPASEPDPPSSPSKRFVWRSDDNHVVAHLAGGPSDLAAQLVGRSWRALGEAGTVLGASLLEALAAHRTFRALPIVLRPPGTGREIEIELSGTPSGRASQPFSGFSGFGVLLREGRSVPHDAGSVPAAISPGETLSDPYSPASRQADDHVLMEPPADELGADPSFPTTGDIPATAASAESDAADAPEVTAVLTEEAVPAVEDAGEDHVSAERNSDLSTNEHAAFREIARALGARFAGDDDASPDNPPRGAAGGGSVMAFPVSAPPSSASSIDAAIVAALDRLPVGVLVHRGSAILYANGRFLDLTGHADRDALQESDGVGRLLGELPPLKDGILPDTPVSTTTAGGLPLALLIERSRVDWDGSSAELLLARVAAQADHAREEIARGLLAERDTVRQRDAQDLLDRIEIGVASLDDTGRVLSLNAGARALLSSEAREVVGGRLADLFTDDSAPAIAACLDEARRSDTGATCEAAARSGSQSEPLRLRVARLPLTSTARFCVTLSKPERAPSTDATRVEQEGRFRADFAGIVSHQIRAPIVQIADRAEILLSDQLGPQGSARGSDYLTEIHSSSQHVVGVIDDLLDLARIEAERDGLTFTDIALNDVVSGCIALMQPQAARDRIVVRTSLSPDLRPLVADERSMRQATLNVIANAIRLTEAGGQVIVSTTDERGEIAFRVRDTGIGMTQEEIERALMASGGGVAGGRAGIGLGLTVTKALVEANRGRFRISSRKNEGTLVEMLFPLPRAVNA